jgi:NADP-dependent aldehyde dehydrogenase
MTITNPEAVQGFDPRTGRPVGAAIPVSDLEAVDAAAQAAAGAMEWAQWSATDRARVLDEIATRLDASVEALVDIADLETGLGRPRLTGEVARTTGQLRLFGSMLREGSFVDAIISPADQALSQPDVRRMVQAIGPVAVFAASNFPFAFSVAGGDTASALAAGCPVVVKAHEAHPGTSILTARLVTEALAATGAPEGTFALVSGFAAGPALVQHPAIKAAGFTGSLRGGRALFDLATGRPDPIPFFGELGSVNPSVVLPGAAANRGPEVATAYAASLTQGTGQFCTNPGLLFVPEQPAMLQALASAVGATRGGPMLSSRIHQAFVESSAALADQPELSLVAQGEAGDVEPSGWGAIPAIHQVDLEVFAAQLETLAQERFGPAGLVVTYRDPARLAEVLGRLDGQLTASIHADPEDYPAVPALQTALSRIAGRLIFNGWPTGVAVCWAMNHGGPWPATTAPGTTSVGATAIRRWLVAVAYQGWPDMLLPEPLQQANPLGIHRRTNDQLT